MSPPPAPAARVIGEQRPQEGGPEPSLEINLSVCRSGTNRGGDATAPTAAAAGAPGANRDKSWPVRPAGRRGGRPRQAVPAGRDGDSAPETGAPRYGGGRGLRRRAAAGAAPSGTGHRAPATANRARAAGTGNRAAGTGAPERPPKSLSKAQGCAPPGEPAGLTGPRRRQAGERLLVARQSGKEKSRDALGRRPCLVLAHSGKGGSKREGDRQPLLPSRLPLSQRKSKVQRCSGDRRKIPFFWVLAPCGLTGTCPV